MAYIRNNTKAQDDSEDLIMAYLNADYFDMETPLSPPSSTTSGPSSPLTSSTTTSPGKHVSDDFMLDMRASDFDIHDIDQSPTSWNSYTTNPNSLFINSCLPSPSPSMPMAPSGTDTGDLNATPVNNDLLNGFPLLLPPVNPFMTPFVNTSNLVATPLASTNSNSNSLVPPSFPAPSATLPSSQESFKKPQSELQHSQYHQQHQQGSKHSSSSDAEQPKKKRGRKKREPVNQQQQTAHSLQPTLLAPKPLVPKSIKTEPNTHYSDSFLSASISSNASSTISDNNSVPLESRTGSFSSIATSTSTDNNHHTTKLYETTPSPSNNTTSFTANNSNQQQQQPDQQKLSQEAIRQAQIQKRQERLIKNRAAALLSRKRKREHLNSLEEDKQRLTAENEQLHQKVQSLESQVQLLEKENLDLKKKLKIFEENSSDNNDQQTVIQMSSTASSSNASSSNNKYYTNTTYSQQQQQKPARSTGIIFMVMLFSFALFTLPTQSPKSSYLTVGGSESFAAATAPKKQYPTIGSSSFNNHDKLLDESLNEFYSNYYNQYYYDNAHQEASTDLVLLDSVRPRDLQMWINDKLSAYQYLQQQQEAAFAVKEEDKPVVANARKTNFFTRWLPKFFYSRKHQEQPFFPTDSNKAIKNNTTDSNGSIYLYSSEFTELAYAHHHHQQQQQQKADQSNVSPPKISIFSPYNRTTTDSSDTYLKIDVQVLNSAIIKGHLLPMHPFSTTGGNSALSPYQALLDAGTVTSKKKRSNVNASFENANNNLLATAASSPSLLSKRDMIRAKKVSRVIA